MPDLFKKFFDSVRYKTLGLLPYEQYRWDPKSEAMKRVGNPIGRRGEGLGTGPVGDTGQYLYGSDYLTPVPLLTDLMSHNQYSTTSSGGTGTGTELGSPEIPIPESLLSVIQLKFLRRFTESGLRIFSIFVSSLKRTLLLLLIRLKNKMLGSVNRIRFRWILMLLRLSAIVIGKR